MQLIYALFIIILFALPVQAQPVQQSGNITPGHAACWAITGVIYDCGAPGGGVSVVGSTTTNDFVAFNASGSLIDSGINPANTSAISGLWNFNGGATAPTRSAGDNTTNVATTAFVTGGLSNIFGVPQTITALWTFDAGIVVNPPTTSPAITTNHTLSGSTGASEYCVGVCVDITSDTAASALGINGMQVTQSYGGPTLTGTRTGFFAFLTQTAKGNAANPFPAFVGITGAVVVNSGAANSTDTIFGENPQVRSAAAGVLQLTGSESDIFGTATATQAFQVGYSAVGIFVNNGTTLDAAYEIHMGASSPYGTTAPGPGWMFGLVAAELSNGYVPIAPTGTFIGTYLGSLLTIPVLNVIDIRGFTASSSQIVGVGFNISPAGAIAGSSLISNGGSATLGINASTGASLALANGGGGGAFAVIKNPSTTSTYNFNLPTTAGTAGQLLQSQGGASTAMTWYSPGQIIPISSAGAVSQNSTVFEVSAQSATEGVASAVCPRAGTFKNLYVNTGAIGGSAQTVTATLRIASASSSLTCQIATASTTCNDATHTVACTAGQLYSLQIVTSATTGSVSFVNGGVEFDPN